MNLTLKNLGIWLGFAAAAVIATLAMTGTLGPQRTGPSCTETRGPGGPGFIALPAGAAPACVRVRIG